MSARRKFILPPAILALLVSALVTAGCSDVATPDNLEPAIEMQPADAITRTGAVISARVTTRGTGRLSYLAFRYGEDGATTATLSPQENPDGPVFTMHLQGLKPGTSYTCYAVGGTSTATLKSQAISFTTLPNERPTVSSPVALSTGPIGLIVEFAIVEDGGEAILEAGCEVADAGSSEAVRVPLPPDCLTPGRHRLHITGLVPMTGYTITPYASNSLGETKGDRLEYTTRNTIVLKEPGFLHRLFAGAACVDLARLTVSGYMDGDDFRFLRHLLGAPALPGGSEIESRVTEIDLSDAYITEGGGPYDGSRFTVADELSTGLLADCANLRSALLPSSATRLARDAFARCPSLERLTISAGISSVLPSEGCTSLTTIEVSQANDSFTAVDGVLFDRGATGIVWFPLGKTGGYSLPATVSEIKENAFYGTSITSLEIPASVTAIGRGAFAGSSLVEISLPDGITNIPESLFQNCLCLTTVRLGESTGYIGNYAFDHTGLRDLYVAATVPPFAADMAFADTLTASCTLHVPYGTADIYRNHPKWGLFSKIEEYRP